MNKALILLFLALALAQTGCLARDKQNTRDKEQIDELYSWDFGKVKEGEVLRHDFLLKNESREILKIKDVNTSCGCTVSKVEKKILLPGEDTLIKVEFESSGYSGPVEQSIYVHTNNLDNPVIRFIIKAYVVNSS